MGECSDLPWQKIEMVFAQDRRSLRELAKLIGVSASYLSQVQRGRVALSAAAAIKMANAGLIDLDGARNLYLYQFIDRFESAWQRYGRS